MSKSNPGLLSLEPRTLFAGDVATSLTAGTLDLIGDADGNVIEITSETSSTSGDLATVTATPGSKLSLRFDAAALATVGAPPVNAGAGTVAAAAGYDFALPIDDAGTSTYTVSAPAVDGLLLSSLATIDFGGAPLTGSQIGSNAPGELALAPAGAPFFFDLGAPLTLAADPVSLNATFDVFLLGTDVGDAQLDLDAITESSTITTLIVRGLDGTTINGAAEQSYDGDAVTSILATLHGGNDSLHVTDLSLPNAPALTYVAGDCDDCFFSNDSVLASLDLLTGVGNDFIRIGEGTTVLGATTIDSGKGSDTIGVVGATLDDLVVETGKGHDLFAVRDSHILGETLVYLERGWDAVVITGSVFEGLARFDAGSGFGDLFVAIHSDFNGGLDLDGFNLILIIN